MILHILALAGGLVVLVVGGEALVRGAVRLAKGLGVSSLLIGLTVVAFGTSAPEFAVTLTAATSGSDSLALANVVGSNIANLLLVLGLATLVRPLVAPRKVVRVDAPAMVLATIAFAIFAYAGGALQRWQGVVLIAGLGTYLVITYLHSRRGEPEALGDVATRPQRRVHLGAAALVVVGFVALTFGSDLIVLGAVGIAEEAGLSERMVGTTIVAIGTSLPEITTCVVAAWRRQPAIALGNIIGSNLFNILFVLGAVTIVAAPVEFAPTSLQLDLPIMLGATGLVMALLATDRRIRRLEGAALLALYAGYLALTLTTH
jgi:cation:H+ antiporter